MSRLFSPDYRPPASYNPGPPGRPQTGLGHGFDEPPRPPRFNPRTKLYDREGNLTGAQIGAKPAGQQARPQTPKLELGTLGAERRAAARENNPFLARMDRVAAARADGTFDAKRNAFNAGNHGSHMDESGNIRPRGPDMGAGAKPQDAGATAPNAGTAPQTSTGGRLQDWGSGQRWVKDQDRQRFKEHDAKVKNDNAARSWSDAGVAAMTGFNSGGGSLFTRMSGAVNAAGKALQQQRAPQSSQGTINGEWSQQRFFDAAKQQKTSNAYFHHDPATGTVIPAEHARVMRRTSAAATPTAAAVPATPRRPW